MTPKPNTTCSNCGNVVYRTPKRIASGERITCSIQCKAQLMRGEERKPRISCRICGEPILRSRSQAGKGGNYCSRKCYYKSQEAHPYTLACDQCGKDFTRSQYDVERRSYNGIFCSRECSGMSQRKRITMNCAVCGAIIERRPSEINDGRHPNGLVFCSIDHSVAYQLSNKGMNGLERDFASAFPEWSYVGDGGFWANDELGPMCPDFIHPTKGSVIELWGNYWHAEDNPQGRINRMKNAGYNCLVIWESDFRENIEDVIHRVSEFLLEG